MEQGSGRLGRAAIRIAFAVVIVLVGWLVLHRVRLERTRHADEGGPPLTSSLADADLAMYLDDSFEPPTPAPLGVQPRGSDGSFHLAPGAYRGTFESFCLDVLARQPKNNESPYVSVPLRGARADLVRAVLQRARLHPDVKEKDVQTLVWILTSREDAYLYQRDGQWQGAHRASEILLSGDERARLVSSPARERPLRRQRRQYGDTSRITTRHWSRIERGVFARFDVPNPWRVSVTLWVPGSDRARAEATPGAPPRFALLAPWTVQAADWSFPPWDMLLASVDSSLQRIGLSGSTVKSPAASASVQEHSAGPGKGESPNQGEAAGTGGNPGSGANSTGSDASAGPERKPKESCDETLATSPHDKTSLLRDFVEQVGVPIFDTIEAQNYGSPSIDKIVLLIAAVWAENSVHFQDANGSFVMMPGLNLWNAQPGVTAKEVGPYSTLAPQETRPSECIDLKVGELEALGADANDPAALQAKGIQRRQANGKLCKSKSVTVYIPQYGDVPSATSNYLAFLHDKLPSISEKLVSGSAEEFRKAFVTNHGTDPSYEEKFNNAVPAIAAALAAYAGNRAAAAQTAMDCADGPDGGTPGRSNDLKVEQSKFAALQEAAKRFR